MVPIIYRCPVTGLNVQGLFADEVPTEKANTYEPVACLSLRVCILVNRSTGKTLNEDSGAKALKVKSGLIVALAHPQTSAPARGRCGL